MRDYELISIPNKTTTTLPGAKMVTQNNPKIGAIVLAAGLSTRMGQNKMLLPWRNTTVIEQVVQCLTRVNLAPIIVVTGSSRDQVENALKGHQVSCVFNPNFANGEMISSILVGMQALPPDGDAFCLVLGDQPQIEQAVLDQMIEHYKKIRPVLVVPSYQMRRGHPWLIDQKLWGELQRLVPPKTLRNFLSTYSNEISYINVNNESILLDLDTPEDYKRMNSG